MNKSYDQKDFVKWTDKRSKARWILNNQIFAPPYLEVSFVKYDTNREGFCKERFVAVKCMTSYPN